ncbi:FxsB family cyclophane-forming radical SAM/SPASM peptide maturase [Nonomuraea sp. NPDC048826]|uniref:FxsB family cyclophane-forming radical SAM/SPASM peptide maturase n=1 Tax=Nonomuraea sp. NPDC048826 TaxID=3364347 RepID=UPI00371F1EB9
MSTPMEIHPERPPEWPYEGLDLEELRREGWEPVPFQMFVVKLHERCNLACDYCYMYELADQSWRSRSLTMSREILSRTAHRISDHVRDHGLSSVSVVLHGGEPLLVGADMLDFAATTLRTCLPASTHLGLTVQTNGTLLTEEILQVLLRHEVRVGVSLDGGEQDNDRHRRYRDGRGSHSGVAAGLRLLNRPEYRSLFSGLLCTIDVENDPLEVYEGLLAFSPPRVDFLLPHGNWSARPPGRPADKSTPYADWLIEIFEHWYHTPAPRVGVRTFQSIIAQLFGRPSMSEQFGLAPARLLVIDTDGSVQQVDTLKSAFEGAAETTLNVISHSFDTALSLAPIAARQIGVRALCESCGNCPVRDVCGGGFYVHRYREGSGFRNPSVYCPDLMKLITHIRDRVHAELAPIIGRRP